MLEFWLGIDNIRRLDRQIIYHCVIYRANVNNFNEHNSCFDKIHHL